MPIVLYRVDERLIHGQVVIGWGSQLHPDRYVVVDDTLAESEWEQELYELSLSGGGAGAEFVSVEEARRRLPEWREGEARSVLLTRDVESMLKLAREGMLQDETVNLGGIHHGEGRAKVCSYIYLDQEDRERIRELAAEGVTVSARDLPDSLAVSLATLLGDG